MTDHANLPLSDDNGFGVDLAFKIPEVTVTAAGGYGEQSPGPSPSSMVF